MVNHVPARTGFIAQLNRLPSIRLLLIQVRYYYEAADGTRHGPADTATLQNWVLMGLVRPSTMLQTEEGREIMVADVAGVRLSTERITLGATASDAGPAADAQPPYADTTTTLAFWFALTGIVTLGVTAFIGFVLSIVSICNGCRKGWGTLVLSMICFVLGLGLGIRVLTRF